MGFDLHGRLLFEPHPILALDDWPPCPLELDLHHDGFLRSYTTWTWHGELLNLPCVSVSEEYVGSTMHEEVHDDVNDDRLEDMIRDVGAESFAKAHGYGSVPPW